MNIKILSVLSALIGINLSLLAQNPTKLEVGLKSGEVFYPEKLQYKDFISDPAYILLDDSVKYMETEISYYRDYTGYYRWMEVPGVKSGVRLKQQKVGRINTYTETRKEMTPGYHSVSTGYNGMVTSFGGGQVKSTRSIDYFQKGEEGKLEFLSYYNLEKALADDPASLKELYKVPKRKKARVIGLCVGGGIAVAGILHTILSIEDPDMSPTAGANQDDPEVKYSPLLFVGGGVMGVSLLIGTTSKDLQKRAIDIYNR